MVIHSYNQKCVYNITLKTVGNNNIAIQLNHGWGKKAHNFMTLGMDLVKNDNSIL